MENEWSVEPNICGTCPIAQGVKVQVPHEIYQAWIELARLHPEEWFAYLLGDAATYTVTGFYFPDQIANSGHCAPIERAERRQGTIGSVHSHHTMGAFFSGEGGDRGHFNWPVEIVVAADGRCLANIRQPLACGKYHRVDTQVEITNSPAYAGPYLEQLKGALKAGEAEKRRLEALKPIPIHYAPAREMPQAYGQFFDRWKGWADSGHNGKGNTTGELIQVPLFDKEVSAVSNIGSEALHEVGTTETYLYCWSCDKTYITLEEFDTLPKCPNCPEQLIEDEPAAQMWERSEAQQ